MALGKQYMHSIKKSNNLNQKKNENIKNFAANNNSVIVQFGY